MFNSYQDPALLFFIKDLKSTELISLICYGCSKSITRTVKWIRYSSAKGRINIYCSNECIGTSSKIYKTCLNCKCSFYGDGKKYCSISCSNSAQPKRKKTIKPIKIKKEFLFTQLSKTKAECLRSTIQKHARIVMKDQLKKCIKCGYEKHVEVCHLKSVSSFPDSALISEINDPKNLTILCPNCHWELDH